jgi:nitrite reductase/ring-hydroxylating ferredoxin subunit
LKAYRSTDQRSLRVRPCLQPCCKPAEVKEVHRREISWRPLGRLTRSWTGDRSTPTVAGGSLPSHSEALKRAGWVAACRRDSLRDGHGRSVDADGLSLAVFLTEGRVFALGNRCLHRDFPVDEGVIEEGCVRCPWHGWRFDLMTGDHLTSFGPRSGLPTYRVIVTNNTVWVQK